MTLRAAVIVDYQNVHITGHQVFAEDDMPLHEGLIHPAQFARQLVARRNQTQQHEDQKVQLGQVEVFRGLPDSEFDPFQNGQNLEQKERWERDPLVRVTHRPLKYEFQTDAGGRRIRDVNGKLMPTGFKEEKGIDVLCALAVVRYALSPVFDVVILASSDSDLTPSLDEAARSGSAKVESCSWFDKDKRWTFGAHKTERKLWNVRMDWQNWDRSIDRSP